MQAALLMLDMLALRMLIMVVLGRCAHSESHVQLHSMMLIFGPHLRLEAALLMLNMLIFGLDLRLQTALLTLMMLILGPCDDSESYLQLQETLLVLIMLIFGPHLRLQAALLMLMMLALCRT